MPTKVVFGRHSIYKLSDEAKGLFLNDKKVAIIGGKSAIKNRYADVICGQLKNDFKLFDIVKPEPTIDMVSEMLKPLRNYDPTLIIAIGGGSSIDVAKVVSVMLTNNGSIEDYIAVPEGFKNKGIPIIAVPTTAGSGSEVTPFAVLTDKENLRKAPLISHYLFPALAIDDPDLTVTMPDILTANTGLDALTHAVESLVSKRATAISSMYSLESIKLIYGFLPRSFGNPRDKEAREKTMLGSLLAGIAITDAGAGLVHTMAHVLGVMYNLPHGLSNAMFLPAVLRFYGLSITDELNQIGKTLNMDADKVIGSFENLISFLKIPSSLKEVGFCESDTSTFINMVMKKKHLMANLPRIPSEKDIRNILKQKL